MSESLFKNIEIELVEALNEILYGCKNVAMQNIENSLTLLQELKKTRELEKKAVEKLLHL